MVQKFISLEWKQSKRSPYWQKSLAIKIFMGIMGLYFTILFLGLGTGLFFMLKKTLPKLDPFTIVKSYIFYWIIGDLMIRFFLQKLPVMKIKPLLLLPIPKSKILHFVLGKSVLSFFNFLSLFIIIPFGIVLIINGYEITTITTWILVMSLLVYCNNFLNFLIENITAANDLSLLPILITIAVLFSLNHFEIISFSNLVSKIIDVIISTPYLAILPFLLLLTLYWWNYKILKSKLYVDGALKGKEEKISTNQLEWLRKLGSIATFLQLDLKLLWRNKRTKSSVFALAIGLFYGLFFYLNPTYKDKEFIYVFVGVFSTGIFLMNFGQFIPAWDSGYYKLLMSQNIKYKEYLNSKYYLMTISCVIMFTLGIPYVYFGWKILLVHFAAMIYNIGVNSHVLLFTGAYNRKKINLDEKAAFNYQGTGVVQWLVSIPLMVVPVAIHAVISYYINFEAGILSLLLLGVLGTLLHNFLLKPIVKSYLKSKYKMISAFEQEN